MIEIAAASAAFKLLLAITGIFFARMTLLWFDNYLMPNSFREWLWGADDISRALYLGLRFLGVCIAVAIILG